MALYQNDKSLALETAIQVKMTVLTALLMTRHKGGANNDNILVHAAN